MSIESDLRVMRVIRRVWAEFSCFAPVSVCWLVLFYCLLAVQP